MTGQTYTCPRATNTYLAPGWKDCVVASPSIKVVATSNEHDVRLRFYGLEDYGTYFQVDRAFQILTDFDQSRSDYSVNDIVEFYHSTIFARHSLLPISLSSSDQANVASQTPRIHRRVAEFFRGINDANFATRISDVNYQYRSTALDLLARNEAFKHCSASAVLAGLTAAGFSQHDLLGNKPLVQAYDHDIRALMLAHPSSAEEPINKLLQTPTNDPIHLPKSLTPADIRSMLDSYIDYENANPNYIRLIASARVDAATGVDARMKLKAKRKHDDFTKTFFSTNTGFRTGCEVSISEHQVEAVAASLDGLVGKYSYSQSWLEGCTDQPTILNNFIYLFEFANTHMLLELPSYPTHIGAIEGLMLASGTNSYRIGGAFRLKDCASFLQTAMYDKFLRNQGIELEEVISWFFAEYLGTEFGAENLRYRASSPMASFLEKSRHLFSEMESVLKQYKLYVENGELDRDLLSMSSGALRYGDVPSLIPDKYVVVTEDPGIQSILHMLFSDQSRLCYINEDLKAADFSQLIVQNEVSYETFAEYQRGNIDWLLDHGVLNSVDGRICFVDDNQVRVLQMLWTYEAVNYRRFSNVVRLVIDTMVAKGWLRYESSLFTKSEAGYFNYLLNQSEYSDGPDLRNRYLHGSQVDGDDDKTHFQTYIIALRLIIAIVIKINDDLELGYSLQEGQSSVLPT